MDLVRELASALRWVDHTDRIALGHFRVDVPTETKPDGTPVTEADRRIEQALRLAIEAEFPGDAVMGEEDGLTGSGPRRWIIDPIDGTKSYRRGIPAFATLLALERDGVLVLGIASAPALGARWWATRGGGAYRNGDPIRVSGVTDLSAADVASGGVGTLRERGYLDGFLALVARADRHRGFADFWGHMLVAQGSIEVMVDPVVSLWDVAACKAIVEEAGGRLTTVEGAERPAEVGSALSTNGALHDEVRALLLG